MGFIKYSVVELGVEENVPGWIKRAETAKAEEEIVETPNTDLTTANKNTEEQEENSIKDQ